MADEPTPYEEMRDDLERIRDKLARLRHEGTASLEEFATKIDERIDSKGDLRRPRGRPPAPPAGTPPPAS